MRPASADELIDAGLSHHSAGRVRQAALTYRSVLESFPDHPDAMHLLGVIALQETRPEEATVWISKAIAADPSAAEFYTNLGEAHLACRRLDAAVAAWTRAMELDSTLVKTQRRLATALQYQGRLSEAAKAWQVAVDLDPSDAQTWSNLGVSLRHSNQTDEALRAFQQATQRSVDFAVAYEGMVRCHLKSSNWPEAIDAARRMVAAAPDRIEALVLQAHVLNSAGRFEDAMASARLAVLMNSKHAQSHFQLGVALEGLLEFEGAALAYSKTSELDPGHFAPHVQRGFVLMAAGDPQRAIEALNQGLSVGVDSMEATYNLAVAYERTGNSAKAAQAAERTVLLAPTRADAHCLLGGCYSKLGRSGDAEASFRRAIALDPLYIASWMNLSNMLGEGAQPAAALQVLRDAARINPSDSRVAGSVLITLLSDPAFTPAQVYAEHVAWGRRFGGNGGPLLHKNHRTDQPRDVALDPQRRLKIGYVSPDLRSHSVAFFLSSLLRSHDRRDFEIVCYDNTIRPDALSRQLRSYVDGWVRLVGMKDDVAAARIRSDGVDILIDLAGHTGDNRLPVFALRAAPVQVNYLGYPATTGLPEMDYRLTDGVVDPPGRSDPFHTEKLIRLPSPFLCFSPITGCPDVAVSPAVSNGYVTFGSFNNLTKLTDEVIDLWAAVLRAVPDARLYLKAGGLADLDSRRRLAQRFADRGVSIDRVIVTAKTATFMEHLSSYANVDIALDSFPYNGTTTTCEAFWMGVPVVSLVGTTHVSRVGATLLHAVGEPGWAADSKDQFVKIAAALASDPVAMTSRRAGLRPQMQASRLCDAPLFTRGVEAAYRQLWTSWCDAQ